MVLSSAWTPNALCAACCQVLLVIYDHLLLLLARHGHGAATTLPESRLTAYPSWRVARSVAEVLAYRT